MQLRKTLTRFLDRVFADPVATLFYIFLALPLIYIPGHHIYSRTLRIFYVFVVALLVLIVPSFRAILSTNIDRLSRRGFWLMLVALILIIMSTTTSELTAGMLLFGREPDYMGIFAWLSIIPFGLLFANRQKQLLLSKTTLCITIAVLSMSLILSGKAIFLGYRSAGLMMQATTMSMYAVLVMVIALDRGLRSSAARQEKTLAVLGGILSVATVVATQSRIGYVGLVIVLTYFANRVVEKRWRVAGGLILLMVGLTVFTLQGNNQYVQRMDAANVRRGINYRLDIYKVTGRDIVRNNAVLGDGPSALPKSLNNVDVVPEDIAKTLRERLLFISSHDLFIDISQYFGLFTGVTTFMACVGALFRRVGGQYSVLKLALVVLLLNSLFNTVSPEMTVMLAMVVLGLLVVPRQKSVRHEKQ